MKDWPVHKVSERRGEFIQDLNRFTNDRLKDNKLTTEELLEKTIYLEKIRVKNNPLKVDPADDKSYWSELESETSRAKKSSNSEEEFQKILYRIINRYNEEIVGNFKIKTFKFAQKFLTFLFKGLLNPAAGKKHRRMWGNRSQLKEQLKVVGHVDEFRSLFTKGTVVIVPTHFSNLDSILIGYAIDLVVGVPTFSYGAGLNLLDNEIVAYFINRLGAYRVDRRKKNPIYLECLKAMASFSLQEGVNQIFFPGGTRSRNGKIEEKLKLGLLGSMVEAQRYATVNNTNNKVYVIPLVLNYHFVLEAKSLINQYLRKTGKEKFTRSSNKGKATQNIFKFIWTLFRKKSDITLSFGQPMDVFGNRVNIEGQSIDKNNEVIDINGYFELEGQIQTVHQREKVYTKLLGEKIVDSFLINNTVLSSHLVAFAAFRILLASNKELNLYDVINIPIDNFSIDNKIFENVVNKMQLALKKMEQKGEIRLSMPIALSAQKCIEDGLLNLGLYHPQKVLKKVNDSTFVSENFRLLYFYHNRLDNYNLEDAVAWDEILERNIPMQENSIS